MSDPIEPFDPARTHAYFSNLKKEGDAFNTDVFRHVFAQGGLPNQVGQTVVALLETQAGLLTITPMGSWVTTRFEDVPKANAFFGNAKLRLQDGFPNPFSGKWNFHGSGAPQSALEEFQQSLVKVLIP